jgi:tetratricopeptide (TPR) repeat protein
VQGTDPTIRTYANTVLQSYNEFSLFPAGQDIHLHTLIARSLAQINECETALVLLSDVVTKQDRYRDAWIVKGYCEFNSERLKDALASLEKAYSLDPEKPEIQYFLARTYAALGDPQNAVTYLQYALLNGFTPENDARELLADYAKELGNTELALEQYKLLADVKDSELPAYERYIDLAVGTHDHALDALASAKNALVRWPDDPLALTLAAQAAFAAGLPQDASSYIRNALKIDPKNPKAKEVDEAIKKASVQQK